MLGGIMAMNEAAMKRFNEKPLVNVNNLTESVCSSASRRIRNGHRKSPQKPMKANKPSTRKTGYESGIVMLRNMRTSEAPSISAASYRSFGIWSKELFSTRIMKELAAYGSHKPR